MGDTQEIETPFIKVDNVRQSYKKHDQREKERKHFFKKLVGPTRSVEETKAAVNYFLKMLCTIIENENFDPGQDFTDENVLENQNKESFLHLSMSKPLKNEGLSENEKGQYVVAVNEVLDFLESKFENEDDDELRKRYRVGIAAFLSIQSTIDNTTVLHKALTQDWGKATVARLLRLGAPISAKNFTGSTNIAKIAPSCIQALLERKINTVKDKDDIHDEDVMVNLDFSFLQKTCDGNIGSICQEPEMKVFQELSQSKQHRHLLLHPVLSAFLALSWESISMPYMYLTIYTFLICITTNMFVFINYGGKSLMTNSTSSSLLSLNARNPNWTSQACGGYCIFPSVFDVGHNDSTQYWQRWVLAMFWVLQMMATLTMVVKEFVQIRDAINIGEMRCIPFINWKPFNGHRNAYLLGLENILQWIYIFLTLVLLAFTACSSQPVNVIRAIAGSSILISWILAINTLARYPVFERQNIHIILFCKVLKKFVVIFMIFAPYILAFSFFFYITLHNDFGPEEKDLLEVSNKDVIEKIDAKGEFLDKAGFSIIKTLAMFVGEMEFSDFPFERAPYFSHIMFIIFLFVIVIVLMNVLTALAVSCLP